MKHITEMLLVVASLLLPQHVLGQPAIEWNHEYQIDLPQYAEALVVAPDGGYAIGGTTQTNQGMAFWLQRISDEGEAVWAREYFLEPDMDECSDLCAAQDGGFLLVGSLQENRDDMGWLVLRVADDGQEIWTRIYYRGGFGSNYALSVLATREGQYLIAGVKRSHEDHSGDAHAILIDNDGEIIWTFTAGGDGTQFFKDVIEIEDGFLLAGTTETPGEVDAILVKIDRAGEIVWQRTFGDIGRYELILNVAQVDGGYMLSGSCPNENNGSDILTILVDDDGENPRISLFDFGDNDYASGLLKVPDEELIVVGRTNVDDRNYRGLLMALSDNGERIWDMRIEEPSQGTKISDLVYDPTRRAVIVCGWIYSNEFSYDGFLAKLNFPPDIIERIPADTTVKLLAGQDSLFTINTRDREEDTLESWWRLNEDKIGQGDSCYFHADQLGEFALVDTVTDGISSVSTSWSVVVTRIIRTWLPTEALIRTEIGDTLQLSVSSKVPLPGARYWWTIGADTISADTIVTMTVPEDTGRYIVRVEGYWLGNQDSHEWTLDVFNPNGVVDYSTSHVPVNLALHRVFPNPFNDRCTIEFASQAGQRVKISLFSIDGRRVRTIFDCNAHGGLESISFSGEGIQTGDYFIHLESQGKFDLQKVVFLK